MKNTFKYFVLSLSFLFLTSLSSDNEVIEETTELVYVKVKVDGLSCPFCAYGLEKKLKKIKGAKDIFIELEGGFATFNVPKEKVPTKEELETIVEDAGFVPREVIFSESPFAKE